MKNILTRLEVLERGQRGDPLVVWAVDEAGNQAKMSVSALLRSDTFAFLRVASGSSLSDLDRLLKAVHTRAGSDCNASPND